MFKYLPEHIAWLNKNYPLMSRKEITVAFNQHFKLDRPFNSVVACIKNHHITSGKDCRFKKGCKPWNKGVNGYIGANKTSFKKGNLPHNHKPLWSERENKDGYIEMSVPETNPYTGFHTRFKCKHVWLWEQENGPTPDGCAIIFKDGDNRNFDLSNLEHVTRGELLAMNLHGYKKQPEEIKPTVLALARLEAKAGFRTQPGRGRV